MLRNVLEDFDITYKLQQPAYFSLKKGFLQDEAKQEENVSVFRQ